MRATLLSLLLISFVSSLYAQNKRDLKGPKFKNYKPWLYKSQAVLLYSLLETDKLIGPAFKNKKRWQQKDKQLKYVPVVFGLERFKRTGPAFKNYKPQSKQRVSDH